VKAVGTMVALVIVVGSARGACVVSEAPPAPRALTFISYNMLHGGMSSGLWGDGERLDARLDAAANALHALDPDVVGLQEASRGWRRGNVATRLGTKLGFSVVDAPSTSMLFGGSILGFLSSAVLAMDEGPAIASRFPIGRVTRTLLPQCHAFYRRVLLCAEICTPWGPVETCSTHLNGSECQAASVDADLRARPRGMPLVLMGDLNASEDAPGLRLLRERSGLVDTFRVANPRSPGYTDNQELDVEHPTADERVDYVLAAPAAGGLANVVRSRVVLDRPTLHDRDVLWSSDHYGVLSEVALFGAPLTTVEAAGARPRAASAYAPAATRPCEGAPAGTPRGAASCSPRAASAHVPRRPPA
jgi:endonuclease/exonuclease/phosphatase family metal-dependent hydrolase